MKVKFLPTASLAVFFQRGYFLRWCKLKSFLLVLILSSLVATASLGGQRLTPMLRFPSLQMLAGQPVLLAVYFHNENAIAVQAILPDSLSLRIQNDDGSTLVTAVETDSSAPMTIATHGFLTKYYRIILPERYQGPVEVLLVEFPESAVLINLNHKPETTAFADSRAEQQPTADIYPTLDSLFSLYQPYATNFSTYEPMYFLLGADPKNSKFQLSFKYRLFNPAGSLSHRFTWLRGFYFAYTQVSFWDLASDSAPFEDTSYKPELFLLTSNWQARPEWMQGFFLQGGIQHESNGRGEEFSRSTNIAYLKPTLIFFDAQSQLGLQLSPKLLAYFNNDEATNPDIADYRGHFELEFKIGKAEGLVSTTQLRFAEKGTSVQTDLSYPISKLLKNNFDLFFQIQYSDTLAENLINYKERDQSLRLGFSIVR